MDTGIVEYKFKALCLGAYGAARKRNVQREYIEHDIENEKRTRREANFELRTVVATKHNKSS